MSVAELIIWAVAGVVAVLILGRAPGARLLATATALVIGVLSLLSIVRLAFNVEFELAFARTLDIYDSYLRAITDRIEPLLNQLLVRWGDDLGIGRDLQPQWRHFFMIMMVHYLRTTTNAARTVGVSVAVAELVVGGTLSLCAAAIAGSVPLATTAMPAALVVVASPIIAFAVAGIVGALAIFAFGPQPFRMNTPIVRRGVAVYLTLAGVGLLLAVIGVQIPQVLDGGSPALTVLGFCILLYSFTLLFAKGAQARLGLLILSVLIATAVLVMLKSVPKGEGSVAWLDEAGIVAFVAMLIASLWLAVRPRQRQVTSRDAESQPVSWHQHNENLKRTAGIQNRPAEGPWYARGAFKANCAGVYDRRVGNKYRPPVDYPDDYRDGYYGGDV